MEKLTLLVLDQFRSLFGIYIAFILACHKAPRKKLYVLRVLGGTALCALLAGRYISFYSAILFQTGSQIRAYFYGIMVQMLLALYMKFCYDITFCQLMFQSLLGYTMANITTLLLRNVFVYTWFPEIESENYLFYIVVVILMYGLCYSLGYHFAIRRVYQRENRSIEQNRKEALFFLCGYFFVYSLQTGLLIICESSIQTLSDYAEFEWLYRVIKFVCIASSILLNLFVMAILVIWHRFMQAEIEKNVINHLVSERKVQYEFSRQNIDAINRKCHDLKHQMMALAYVENEERKRLIQETQKSVDFYDAVIHTGNEALDTILTEKSMICTSRNIKISCNISTINLAHIKIIDLYTMLGNAIDNAIEYVQEFLPDEKKVVDLTILNRGNLICISIENYYIGEIRMKNGLPITHKKDKENHGFGIRSIRILAKSYGGDIAVTTENGVFRLQILLPVNV